MMTELEKLGAYLQEHNIAYERYDSEYQEDDNGRPVSADRHQITVRNSKGRYMWDAICQQWSYGHKQGLLEIAGSISRAKKDVEGYLTAADVIERIENG